MSNPRWSEATAELVAEATEKHHLVNGQTDAMGNSPCVCGQWWDAAGDNPGWDQHMAEVTLTALADAGWLSRVRTWHEGDPEPIDVTAVLDTDNDLWKKVEGGWRSTEMALSSRPFSWTYITEYAPLTEVTS